jgi:hypothetical protein
MPPLELLVVKYGFVHTVPTGGGAVLEELVVVGVAVVVVEVVEVVVVAVGVLVVVVVVVVVGVGVEVVVLVVGVGRGAVLNVRSAPTMVRLPLFATSR